MYRFFSSLLREGIDQVSAEGVLALGVSTQLSAGHQLNIHLTAASELQKNRLRAAVLWILTVIFPGRGHQLAVLHQLQLLVEPLTRAANVGVRREGEGVEASVRSRERACEESGSGWCLCLFGFFCSNLLWEAGSTWRKWTGCIVLHKSKQEISLTYTAFKWGVHISSWLKLNLNKTSHAAQVDFMISRQKFWLSFSIWVIYYNLTN